MSVFTRGFHGRRSDDDGRLPPGQYLTDDFPVLSAGPTPAGAAGPLGVHGAHRDGRRAHVVVGRADRPAHRDASPSTSTA